MTQRASASDTTPGSPEKGTPKTAGVGSATAARGREVDAAKAGRTPSAEPAPSAGSMQASGRTPSAGPAASAGRTPPAAAVATTGSGGVSGSVLAARAAAMPKRLRTLRAVGVVGCLVAGGALAVTMSTQSNGATTLASATSAHYLADAVGAVENMRAEGGLRVATQIAATQAGSGAAGSAAAAPAAAATAFDTAVAKAEKAMLTAARNTGDADVQRQLEAANIGAYVAGVERAVVLARTDVPNAVLTYQGAEQTLRSTTVTPMASTVNSTTTDLAARRDPHLAGALLGGATTLGLIAGGVWLARRTHRLVNPGLTLAAVTMAGLTYVSLNPGLLPGSAPASANQLKAATTALNQAHAARSLELRTLLGPATAASGETTFATAAAAVTTTLTGSSGASATALTGATSAASTVTAWRAYTAAPRVAAKTAPNASASAQFRTATTGLSAWVAQAGGAVVEDIGRPMNAAAPGALLIGTLAGVFLWVGIGRRLKEYQ